MSETSKSGTSLRWIGIISALIMSVLTPLSQLEFPEWWSSEKDSKAIKHEIHEQLLNLPSKMGEKYSKDSARFENKIFLQRVEIVNLKKEIASLGDTIKLIDRQVNFNTQLISITNEAVIEEMDKKVNSCDWVYYKTNEGDNWSIFNDLYNCRALYSVDLRSDCRAYYTPLFREKTKIQ